jgi:hypothetical protein
MERSALVTGLSFTDPASGVTLTSEVPCSNTLNGNIGVTIGAMACVRANPDLTISPTTNQSISAGGSATYTLSLKNNDSSGCATGNFNLTATPPSGWGANLGSVALAIAPGGTASTSLTVTAPSGVADASTRLRQPQAAQQRRITRIRSLVERSFTRSVRSR